MSQSDSEARGSSSQRPSGSKSSAKPIARGSPVANFAEHSCPDSCDRLGVADYANACPENLTLNGSLHGDTFFLVDRLLGSPLPVGGTFFFLAGLAVAQKWRFCSADLFGAVSGCRPACSAGVISSSLSAIDRPSPTPVRSRIGGEGPIPSNGGRPRRIEARTSDSRIFQNQINQIKSRLFISASRGC